MEAVAGAEVIEGAFYVSKSGGASRKTLIGQFQIRQSRAFFAWLAATLISTCDAYVLPRCCKE